MIFSSITGVESLIGTIASVLAIIGGVFATIKSLLRPIAAKVAAHDGLIQKASETSTSTNIKVARIEGFLAGQGHDKLPDVTPTVEIPKDGGIEEKPLI
jgi:hypothetical protein